MTFSFGEEAAGAADGTTAADACPCEDGNNEVVGDVACDAVGEACLDEEVHSCVGERALYHMTCCDDA